MNKMKIKIFALLSLIITFSFALSSCDSLWDDLNALQTITISFDSNTGNGTMEPQIFEPGVPQALNENKFTKEGYTFAGWATKADASEAEYADKANFTAKEDITLYAIWNVIPPENPPENPPAPVPITFTITYVSDKGTLPESKTVDQGYKLTAEDLKELSKTGYRFIGWDKSVGDEITADTTITASWIKTWTITYSSSQGTAPETKTVDEGYQLTATDLSTLTADGYNFKGWDKVVGDEITADTTITASWVKTWKITYVLPSGYSKEPKIVEAGYKLTAEDLPNIETNDTYYLLNKKAGDEITADTQITGDWDGIVYLKTFSNVQEIKDNKAKIEKIIFTTDSYTGTGTTINCADDSTNTAIGADYFTGVLTDGATAGQYILTIYGNGHRIYAPEISSSLFSGFSKVTNIEFNNFYTSKVTNMQQMFTNCKLLVALDLSSFDTSAVTNMYMMFANCNALSSLDISSFNTSNVTDFSGMFMGLSKITELNLSNFDTSKGTTMRLMFSNCEKLTSLNLSSFNTSLVQTMNGMFSGCYAIESLDVSKLNTSAVTDMSLMFSGCKNIKELDLSGFVTSSVTNMTNMFNLCESLKELNLSSFNTSSVQKMTCMFKDSTSLESIIFSSNFNTENVTEMKEMFLKCSNLTNLDVSKFNTSAVTDMSSMFEGCSSLKALDVLKFNTESVEAISNIFKGCSSLKTLDISSFTITSVKDSNLDSLFDDCTELTTIYVSSGFDLSSSYSDVSIFSNNTNLVGGAGTKYSDVAAKVKDECTRGTYARIDGGPTSATPGYFTLKQ